MGNAFSICSGNQFSIDVVSAALRLNEGLDKAAATASSNLARAAEKSADIATIRVCATLLTGIDKFDAHANRVTEILNNFCNNINADHKQLLTYVEKLADDLKKTGSELEAKAIQAMQRGFLISILVVICVALMHALIIAFVIGMLMNPKGPSYLQLSWLITPLHQEITVRVYQVALTGFVLSCTYLLWIN